MNESLAYIGVAVQIALAVALLHYRDARHERMFFWGKVTQITLCAGVYAALYLRVPHLDNLYWGCVFVNTVIDGFILRFLRVGYAILDTWALVLVVYSYVKAVELLFSPVYSSHALDEYYYFRQMLDIALDALSIAAVYTMCQHHRRMNFGHRTETQVAPAYPCR